MTFRYIRLIY